MTSMEQIGFFDLCDKYGLFQAEGCVCVPEGVNLSDLCDDFEAIGRPVVVFAGTDYDYLIFERDLKEGWNE